MAVIYKDGLVFIVLGITLFRADEYLAHKLMKFAKSVKSVYRNGRSLKLEILTSIEPVEQRS